MDYIIDKENLVGETKEKKNESKLQIKEEIQIQDHRTIYYQNEKDRKEKNYVKI